MSMANTDKDKRSRSTTSASVKSNTQRPISRGSTHSIQSFDQQDAPQFSQEHSQQDPPVSLGASFSTIGHQQQNHPYLEDAILQLGSRSQDQMNAYGMDLSMNMDNHPLAQHSNGAYTPNNNMYPQPNPVPQFAGAVVAAPNREADRRKRGNSSQATNDRELRELLSRSNGKTLKDVATEVISTERTPRAERTKQLFAMLWLRETCKKAKTSVPRNRVYSYYAGRCAEERVQPLNPASFGKLVRVIFPGIQTRRLGVRGESKYHYVDMALVDDTQTNQGYAGPSTGASMPTATSNHGSRHASVSQGPGFAPFPRLTADTAVMPTQDQAVESPMTPVLEAPSQSHHRVYAEPNLPWNTTSNVHTSRTYEQRLKFPPAEGIPHDNDTIDLPNVFDFAPPKTDVDAANNLVACYRAHATSLVDCIRFCKEKQFFRLFTSFHGTMTVPTQKLFAHQDIAPWIRECDWHMYQKMIRFVSRLTLEAVPTVVLKFLDSISNNLHAHLTKTFQGFPMHVLEARLGPATLFANLLHRMLRANSTAHAAAALLMTDECREQMWQDWVNFVNPKRVMEVGLPGCGHDEVFQILTRGVHKLLQPLNMSSPFDDLPDVDLNGLNGQVSNDTIIDRVAQFVASLPGRFPQANARTVIDCINSITTAALREITVHNGPSFGLWWVTKTFIDEEALWLATLGGFLDHPQSSTPSMTPNLDPVVDGPLINSEEGSRQSSRFSSIGANLGPSNQSPPNQFMQSVEEPLQASTMEINHASNEDQSFDDQMGAGSVSTISRPATAHGLGLDHDFDDSGIGMSLMDESTPIRTTESKGHSGEPTSATTEFELHDSNQVTNSGLS